MTNEQLLLYLTSLLERLSIAVQESEELMPENAEREITTHTRLRPEFQGQGIFLAQRDQLEEYEIKGDHIALQPIHYFLHNLSREMEILREDGRQRRLR